MNAPDKSDITPAMQARMPKPVVEYIEQLEMRLKETQQALKDQTNQWDGQTERGIIINPYSGMALHLDLTHTVRFWIVPGEHAIDARIAYNKLDVTVWSPSARGLTVHPRASNCAYLGVNSR